VKAGILAAGVFILGPAVAFGADLKPREAPYRAPEPIGWVGFYAGVHGGYGFGDFDRQTGWSSSLPIANAEPGGGFGGFQLGWNGMLAPSWIIGTEADVSFGSLSDSVLDTDGNLVSSKVDAFGTVRTRLGYVFDNRSLLYITGGLAWARNKVSVVSGSDFERLDSYHVGWTIGGGFEYAFDPYWSAKIEYLYSDLDQWRAWTSIATNDGTRGDLTFSTIKAGLNYRFGPGIGTPSPSVMPVKAPVASAAVWQGSYVGAHAGYAWGEFDAVDINISAPMNRSAGLSPSGWLGGFQAGYNWQFAPNALFGFEADNSFMSLKDDGLTGPDAVNAHAEIKDLGTVRARLGYVAGNTLVYATGGLAYARVKYRESGPGIDAFATDYYHLGWAAGAGIEYAFAPRWSVKLEYLYADLGKTESSFNFGTMSTDLSAQVVRAGLNYQFRWSDLFGGL
jgi:outer membrane immunogenic protein